jgi:hypothetical protein
MHLECKPMLVCCGGVLGLSEIIIIDRGLSRGAKMSENVHKLFTFLK